MKSIDERIIDHVKARRKLNDEKNLLEMKLNKINEKIIFHFVAIQNLAKKKTRTSGDDV